VKFSNGFKEKIYGIDVLMKDNIQSARLAGFEVQDQQLNYLFKKQNLQK
jgi:hypothetical protein